MKSTKKLNLKCLLWQIFVAGRFIQYPYLQTSAYTIHILKQRLNIYSQYKSLSNTKYNTSITLNVKYHKYGTHPYIKQAVEASVQRLFIRYVNWRY